MEQVVYAELVQGAFDGAIERVADSTRTITKIGDDGIAVTYVRVPSDDPNRVVFMFVTPVGAR